MATRRSEEITDTQLVEQILEGNSDSFNILHDRYRDRIHRFAIKRLNDPVEAEDVVQEVFLQVHRCLGSFQGRSSLLTWMFGIAHNQVCRRFRRQTPLLLDIEDIEVESLTEAQVPAERQIDAVRMLERCDEILENEVSDLQRTVFHLKYGENRSTREIAKATGKSNQAVKIGLFRSRRVLANRTKEFSLALNAA